MASTRFETYREAVRKFLRSVGNIGILFNTKVNDNRWVSGLSTDYYLPYDMSVHLCNPQQSVIDLSVESPLHISFDYLNHKGEQELRRVKPLRRAIWFGSTLYHPEVQWFLHAWDLDRNAERDFAMKDIKNWKLLLYTVNTEIQVEPKVE